MSFDPEYRPTFEELEGVIEGTNTDFSLQWIANGQCSLGELWEELHERSCSNTAEELRKFVNIKAMWKKIHSFTQAVSAFKVLFTIIVYECLHFYHNRLFILRDLPLLVQNADR